MDDQRLVSRYLVALPLEETPKQWWREKQRLESRR
jgi:hypothetical protein